jgi:hypothetical protein
LLDHAPHRIALVYRQILDRRPLVRSLAHLKAVHPRELGNRLDRSVLHAWNAGIDDIEHADMLVFDLDSGEGVVWESVIETALTLQRMLRDEGLQPWPKLTLGKVAGFNQ